MRKTSFFEEVYPLLDWDGAYRQVRLRTCTSRELLARERHFVQPGEPFHRLGFPGQITGRKRLVPLSQGPFFLRALLGQACCRSTASGKAVLLQPAPQLGCEFQQISRPEGRFQLLHAAFQTELAHRPFPEPHVLVKLAALETAALLRGHGNEALLALEVRRDWRAHGFGADLCGGGTVAGNISSGGGSLLGKLAEDFVGRIQGGAHAGFQFQQVELGFAEGLRTGTVLFALEELDHRFEQGTAPLRFANGLFQQCDS
jgi:hypothetical protein